MRTITSGEKSRLSLARLNFHLKILIADHTGTLIDYTNAGGQDWVQGASMTETQDQPVATATIKLKRAIGSTSLSPLMGGSSLNSGGAAIDIGREVQIKVATTDPGVAPVSGDWKTVFDGKVDDVAWNEDPIVVTCRDQGGWLQDAFIEIDGQSYGSGGGSSVESVIQAIINAWVTVSTPTLSTPSSPGWNIFTFSQARKNVMEAIRDLALQIGWDLRYRYDASNNFLLTLMDPNRAATTSLYTFTKDEYLNVTDLKIAGADVRNAVQISFVDHSSGVLQTVTRINSASISAYRRQFMAIQNPTNITDSTHANALGDAIVSDLGAPPANQEIETFLWWPIQLFDLYTFQANGVHYDSDQKWAVVAYTHEWSEGGKARTKIQVRGSVSGAYRTWLRMRAGADSATGEIIYSAPVAQLAMVEQEKTFAIVQLNAITDPAAGAINWQYRFTTQGVPGAWTGYSTAALPTQITITRRNLFATSMELQVLQVDGQTDTARMDLQGELNGLATVVGGRTDEDVLRAGARGGLPTPGGSFHSLPVYTGDGTQEIYDPVLGRFTTNAAGPTGIGMTVIERGGNKGDNTIDGSNRVKRGNGFDDGNYGATATSSDGYALHSSVKDSRSSLLNNHFRISTDTSDSVVDGTGSPLTGGKRGFNALNTSNALVSSIDAAATGSDGFSNVESRRGAAKQSGVAARGIVAEGRERSGSGGVDTPGSRISTEDVYDRTGATHLLDPVAQVIKPALGMDTGYKMPVDVATYNAGKTASFSMNRQNYDTVQQDGGSFTFPVAYDAPPQIRAMIQAITNPNNTDRWDVKATSITTTGFSARAKHISGGSSVAESEQWAATLNGTPVSSVTIQSNNAAAYCKLSNANSTGTSYFANFDVDTTTMDASNTLTVSLYRSTSSGGTPSVLVAAQGYSSGLSITGASLEYDASTGDLNTNYNFELIITYTFTPSGPKRATVTANSVTYNKVTAGTESNLTPAGTDGILFQSMVAP